MMGIVNSYRGSPALTLKATSWAYEDEKFLNNGSILSDHNPITSRFTWTKSDSFRLSNLYGGPHGYPPLHPFHLATRGPELTAVRTWFNDLPSLSSTTRLSSISISGGNRLDSLTLTFTNGTSVTHGGSGGTAQTLTFADEEVWTATKLCQGKYNDHTRIFYIRVTTDQGNEVAVGTETSECVTYEAESGWGVVGAWGRAGDEVDMLGVVYGAV